MLGNEYKPRCQVQPIADRSDIIKRHRKRLKDYRHTVGHGGPSSRPMLASDGVAGGDIVGPSCRPMCLGLKRQIEAIGY